MTFLRIPTRNTGKDERRRPAYGCCCANKLRIRSPQRLYLTGIVSTIIYYHVMTGGRGLGLDFFEQIDDIEARFHFVSGLCEKKKRSNFVTGPILSKE